MNKQAKQVIQLCRRIVKQVRHDNYFSATVRANFVMELEKFDSKRGHYLIVVRDLRVSKIGLNNRYRLRADWLNVRDPSFDYEIWKMANDVLVDMQVNETEERAAATPKKSS